VADEIDRAQALDEAHREQALASHHMRAASRLREARTHCRRCGDPIPKTRREAMPGADTCVECQASEERQR
jgi:phage/conjugal plasmid C-4 type zinc finger TraR family protein